MLSLRQYSSSAITRLYMSFSPKLREKIKRLLLSEGHRGGILDEWRAIQLARGSKKASQLSRFCLGRLLEVVGGSLDGFVIMEYGAGFLMAEPLIYTMYGAKRVDAVDYNMVLRRRVLRHYAAHTDWEVAMDVAASSIGKEKVSDWKARLDQALRSESDDWHELLGIRYIAPYDIASQGRLDSTYDLIVSQSTLEHVPARQAELIVKCLSQLVKLNGWMYHYVHLEDHRDMVREPFAFLGEKSDYTNDQADARGNRLRASEWMKIMESIEGFSWEKYPHAIRPDASLPSPLLEQYRSYSLDDLMTSHLTIKGFRSM